MDAIVVGSGLTGSVIARKLAEDLNMKVLVLEKRNHIGGNVYDEKDEDGILVQRYGPHLFHTNLDEVYEFLSRFTKFEPYCLEAAACIDGKNLPMPFNFTSIDFFYDEGAAIKLKNKLCSAYSKREIVNILELLKHEDNDIKGYGQVLFEKDYRLYSSKQWGVDPKDIDSSILKRVPIFLSYRTTRFDDKYQCLPCNGFTDLVDKILFHPNIQIKKNVDAFEKLKINLLSNEIYYENVKYSGLVIYTGPIDELQNFKYGELQYRSIEIKYEKYNYLNYLEYPAIAYPQADGFVRKTEYTKLPYQNISDKTVIGIEYPVPYDRNNTDSIGAAYPILNQKNCELYQKYLTSCNDFKNLIICGRLGDFKYYDMDQAVKRALDVSLKIKKRIL